MARKGNTFLKYYLLMNLGVLNGHKKFEGSNLNLKVIYIKSFSEVYTVLIVFFFFAEKAVFIVSNNILGIICTCLHFEGSTLNMFKQKLLDM